MKLDLLVTLIVDLAIPTGNYVDKVVRTNMGTSLKFGKENELLRGRYHDGNKTIICTPDNEEQEIEHDRIPLMQGGLF